jgi:hypothetical protein
LKSGLAMRTDATGTRPVSTPSASVASNWSKPVRKVLMPMCLTANSAVEWTGSTVKVPAGSCWMVALMVALSLG